MSGYWSVVTATTPAAVTAPASTAAGLVLRVRGLAASGTGLVTITDSISGLIWQVTIATGTALVETDLDVRGSVGGNLTIASAGGTGVSVQGDYVTIGYPYGLT